MGEPMPVAWWARGLLFENCSCQLVCPGHLHFEQFCTKDRCKGYWAVRFDDGEFDGVALGGAKAVIIYDTPRHMIDGNWIEGLIVDAATPREREAVETILKGQAGGPWAVLARFVGRWLETRHLPVRIVEEGGAKHVGVDGVLESAVSPIRGRDRTKPVVFENIFNQIHSPRQVIARGSATYEDGHIAFRNEGTHGLYSTFDWRVTPS